MKKFTLLSAMLLGLCYTTYAQRNCGTMAHLDELINENPLIRVNHEAIEDFTRQFIESGAAQNHGRSIITIPVVVHVVYKTAAQNVSDAQIQSQLDVLNADYHKLNADWSNTPAAFQGAVADCEVQFCLAQRDPNGNATNGIVRKATAVTSFSTNDKVKHASTGGDDAWPASSYLNIWVCNLSSGLLGYAQFPGGAASTDGVVITYTGFGTVGTATAPFDKGRTATHEVGHWLNLYHIWGDDNGACTGSDNVNDTPNQGSENYGCPSFPHVSCSNGPNGDMFMNYMDYTDDACMYMFTAGQKARMQALFAAGGARYSILSSLGCQSPGGGGTTCAVPTGLTANNITETTATLTWTAVSGATSYNVQIKPSSSSTWSSGATTTNAMALSGMSAGTAYDVQVQAVCSNGPGAYCSVITFTTLNGTPPVSCTDNYESNNTRKTAKPIPVNTDITAMIGASSDVDYFKFANTKQQKNIRITLRNLPGDYDVRLYASNGSLKAISQNSGTADEVINYNTTKVGTYYVQVYGYSGAYSVSDCYTLQASISSTNFKLEENNANTVNDKVNTVVNLYPNPTDGYATLEMYYDEWVEEASVMVYDVSGKAIKAYQLSNVEGEVRLNIDLTDAQRGIYYVVIRSPYGSETKKLIITQ